MKIPRVFCSIMAILASLVYIYVVFDALSWHYVGFNAGMDIQCTKSDV